jgi:hypothetical protein
MKANDSEEDSEDDEAGWETMDEDDDKNQGGAPAACAYSHRWMQGW